MQKEFAETMIGKSAMSAAQAKQACNADADAQYETIRARVMDTPFPERLSEARQIAKDLRITLMWDFGGPASEAGQRQDTNAMLRRIDAKLHEKCR